MNYAEKAPRYKLNTQLNLNKMSPKESGLVQTELAEVNNSQENEHAAIKCLVYSPRSVFLKVFFFSYANV